MLLIVAGLLGRSWLRLTNLDPGFNVSNVLAASVDLPPVAYAGTSSAKHSIAVLDGIPAFLGFARWHGSSSSAGRRGPRQRRNLPATNSPKTKLQWSTIAQ